MDVEAKTDTMGEDRRCICRNVVGDAFEKDSRALSPSHIIAHPRSKSQMFACRCLNLNVDVTSQIQGIRMHSFWLGARQGFH